MIGENKLDDIQTGGIALATNPYALLGGAIGYVGYKATEAQINWVNHASEQELVNFINMDEPGDFGGTTIPRARIFLDRSEIKNEQILIFDIARHNKADVEEIDELHRPIPIYSVNSFAKTQHKNLLWAIAKSSVNPDMCAIKVYSNGQKVQVFADLASQLFPYIDRDLYPRPNVVGILQHKGAAEIYDEYARICDDKIFATEISFKNNNPIEKNESYKGSTRADFVTKNIADKESLLQSLKNPNDLKEHYNLKFGAQDVLQVEYSQHLKNLPKGTDFYQVKPGEPGPREVKELLESKKK